MQPLRSQRRDIRLGVIAALTNAGVQPFMTMADDRVYDSRQDPLFHRQGRSDLPAVVVYTDTTRRTPISQGLPPFTNVLDVIIEMSIGGVGSTTETDAEMEDKLDTFEEQVLFALFGGYDSPNSHLFTSMIKRVHSADSMRLANAEASSRLALRDLVVTVEYDDKCKNLACAFPDFIELRMRATKNGEEVAMSIDTDLHL